MALEPAERMAMLERLEEVYRTTGQRGVSPSLLALQQLYQAQRSEDNAPINRMRVSPGGSR